MVFLEVAENSRMDFLRSWRLALCVLLIIWCRDDVDAIDETSAMMSAMLSKSSKNGYDTRVRPTADATNVSVQITLVSFGPIIQKTMSVKSDIILHQWWKDTRLAFDNASSFTFHGDPSYHIWLPDVYISNARDLKAHHGLTKNIKCTIGPNGNVYVSARLTVEFSCDTNYRLFPFDTQTCSMNLESYAYTAQEMKIRWKFESHPVDFIEGSVHLLGYKITKIEGVVSDSFYIGTEAFSLLQAKFFLHRLLPYYLYHIYIPGSCLVALSWCTFWIAPTAIPARVSLIVTNFLSSVFVLHTAVASIPKVPYATALELFGLVNILSIIMVMIEFIFVLRSPGLMRKTPARNILKGIKLRRCVSPKTENTEKENNDMVMTLNSAGEENIVEDSKDKEVPELDEHSIDIWARFVAPVVYIIFVIAYFSSYKDYILM